MYRPLITAAAITVLVMSIIFPWNAPAQEKPAATPVKATKLNDNYLVGAGDVLRIIVWKNEDLTGEYLVRPDGKITLPLVGDIVGTGKSTDAIAMQISKKVELFIEDPFITVILQNAISNVVYILGEVNNPGVYPLQGRLSVIQALALAGGYTEFAKDHRMVLIRQEGAHQRKFDLDYRKILQSPEAGHNLLLKRGDTLVVP